MKVNPYFPIRSFGEAIDTLFNSSLSDIVGSDYSFRPPNVNVIEEDNRFLIELAAPGLSKADFNIEVDEDQLKISSIVKKAEETQAVEKDYKRREFNYQSFTRSFKLPKTIDKASINANYKNGILNISLDKLEEAIDKGPKSIKID